MQIPRCKQVPPSIHRNHPGTNPRPRNHPRNHPLRKGGAAGPKFPPRIFDTSYNGLRPQRPWTPNTRHFGQARDIAHQKLWKWMRTSGWRSSSGARALALELWCSSSGSRALALDLWLSSSGSRSLALEPWRSSYNPPRPLDFAKWFMLTRDFEPGDLVQNLVSDDFPITFEWDCGSVCFDHT